MCLLAIFSCQTTSPELLKTPYMAQEEALSLPDSGPSFAGQFLAARYAQQLRDNDAASRFFSNALVLDSSDEMLLRYSFINHYQNGNLDIAIELAREIERLNYDFALAVEPAIAKAVRDADWPALLALCDKIDNGVNFGLLAGGLRTLAYIGLDEPETALQSLHDLKALAAIEQVRQPLIQYLESRVFELLGKKQEAEKVFRDLLKDGQDEYALVLAGAGLWRLGYHEEIEAFWAARLPDDLAPLYLIQLMQAQKSSVFKALTLEKAMAQFLFFSSWLSEDEFHRNLLIARAHLALSIWPDFDIAHLALAHWYMNARQMARAQIHLDRIGPDSFVFLRKRLIHLAIAERIDTQNSLLSVLRDELTTGQFSLPEQIEEYSLLAKTGGDMLRRAGQCERALDFYQLALEYFNASYQLYRNIGICFEQTGQSQKAEEALLKAIDLNPDDSVSLNYLGYWWADEGRHLEQAITFIKRAVNLRPDSGYYADSLGWIYFRQGQYDRAVFWLEKAIQLTPTDAIISDHLGDAYWQAGRYQEARFKWQHALDMGIEDARIENLKKKLEKGL